FDRETTTCPVARSQTEIPPFLTAVRQSEHCGCDSLTRSLLHEQAALSVFDDLDDSTDGSGNDRQAGRHRLQDREPEAFRQTRAEEAIEAVKTIRHVLPEAHEVDPRTKSKLANQFSELGLVRPGANDDHGGSGVPMDDVCHCSNRVLYAFGSNEAREQ